MSNRLKSDVNLEMMRILTFNAKRPFMKLLSSLLLFSSIFYFIFSQAHANTSIPFEKVIADILPSAVVIESDEGHGSGIILSENGVIVTNLHVIVDVRDISVKLSNGSRFDEVQILGFDEKNDLAILKVSGRSLPYVDLNFSTKAQIGQTVYALGAPEGLEQTLSKGIVSSIRTLEDRKLIQTDAAISAGSSGGGLFSQNGELLGVLVSYFKEGQNLNFAIPTELIKPLLIEPVALTETEFFALNIHQENAYDALNAMSSSDVLETFLSRMSSEYNFEYAKNNEFADYVGLYADEVPIIFELFDDLVLMTLPLVIDTAITPDDFIALNTLSLESNYSYLGFVDSNVNVYAEMPVKNVRYEAFEAVISGAINGYMKAKKSDLIKKLNAHKESTSTENNYLSEFTETLPAISLNKSFDSSADVLVYHPMPMNMGFFYDEARYNFELIEQSDNYLELSLTPKRERVFLKVISEPIEGVEDSLQASAFVMSNYLEGLQDEFDRLTLISKGTRRIGNMNATWAKYEYSHSGLRYKFQSTFLIANNRGLTFHAWSFDDFSKLDSEVIKIIETLNF